VKIVVFGPEKRVGVWAGDIVIDLAKASASLSPDLLRFIEGSDESIREAQRAVAEAGKVPDEERGVYAIRDVQLHAPHVPGARVACAGGNFADHAAAMAQRTGKNEFASLDLKTIAERLRASGIWGFWKVGRDAAGPGADIVYPARTHRLDYEAELAIVFGKRALDVKAGDLKPYIWGVTLFGDWSIRDGREAPQPLKFGMSKNFNGSFSVGPCIVVGEGIDEANVDIETWVNGERRQHFNTRDMILSFGEYLEYLSADFTFHPGDMITGGTAAGTAADSSPRSPEGVVAPDRFLKPGDRVEMRSPAIGTLAAQIVAKQ
jgi:2-keto-4-pentenoate hydratase/2-oxohepta-3-ene-1,7-dioic acid hydratase in catechol pathway